jgi:MoaA/NifB/PqqE/SkfB family radical SAM enzyme
MPVAIADQASGAAEPAAYGFGGHLSAAFPSQVIIDVTELCNLACTHCPHPAFKTSEHYGGRTLDPALSAKAVGEVATAGRGIVQQIRYASDGEPMLYPGLFAMLADAVSRSGTLVSLTTNGTLLTPERIDRLLDTGLGFVDISIDAYSPETYARVRVRGDLSVTRANVERLIDRARARGSATRVVVSYIEQPDNRHETADFERFWRGRGADAVLIRRLHSASGSIVPLADLMRKRAVGAQRRPCVYPWERIVVTPRGTLAFCPADWTRGSSLVDYRDTTIAELWQSERYRALRRAHLTNDFTGHGFCGQCPDWQETRWPHEGPSYSTLVDEMRGRA